ncbi:MAG: type II secretion system protein [Planctomycetota bacterium]|jgi:type II secretory pathway pseudopilin PulG|nr:type II secretion system protein [Planctomycetota bacterium]
MRWHSSSGLSLIEVIISIAILSTALMALVGNIFTLNTAQKRNLETQRVQEIASNLAERLQGVQWKNLGQDGYPWTFLRRGPVQRHEQDPAAGIGKPPMTEDAADDANNLLSADIGLLAERSGLEDLRVWVEYRRMSSLTGVFNPILWNKQLADTSNEVDPGSLISFDHRTFDEALLVRIIIRWQPSDVPGPLTGPMPFRHYEISLARRR